ncbi:MAG: NUDIX hydrolase [Candidatus Aenigmarchaeota archaeon]|nr:NUDIX hydrolase [Candidatus Aenigmarchaeota archaeon]
MKTYVTVVGVVQHKDKILLLKRTPKRRSSPNKWQTVSGFVNEHESVEDAVLREVKEETGLDGKIVDRGEIFIVEDEWGRWISIPFLVSVQSDKVKIDKKEHTEYKWIKPENVSDYDCVSGIDKDLRCFSLI